MTQEHTMTSITEAIDAIVRHAESYEEAVQQILEEFVVIPRGELPEVATPEPGYLGIGKKRFTPRTAEGEWVFALDHLALSLHLEEQKSAAAETKRNARRDAIAKELGEGSDAWINDYASLSVIAQRAIDRIIELEEASA